MMISYLNGQHDRGYISSENLGFSTDNSSITVATALWVLKEELYWRWKFASKIHEDILNHDSINIVDNLCSIPLG